MYIRTWIIALVFTLSVLLGGVRVTAQPPQPEDAPAPDATPVETLLNPDGTLRLDGSFSGALDVSGWQVTLDPEQGPIFQPQAGTPRWTNLGSAPNGALNGPVFALAVSGSDVYVGGYFTDAAGIAEADRVARWNGSTWSALGGSGGTGALTGSVFALAVSGSDVYVGGSFFNAAGIPEADYVARWDSTTSTWSALGGSGGTGALNNTVRALAVSGSDVYVGGDFTDAAGIAEADAVAAYAAPPSVSAITRLAPNPTSAASVQFQVVFDEPVTGVAASDFTLTTTGSLSGASVTGVSGSGATYVVTVATGTGNGTLRLDVPAGATITDQVGFSLSNLPFTGGQAYTVNNGGGSPTPTPTPPGATPTPSPTPPGGGAPIRVYLPLARR